MRLVDPLIAELEQEAETTRRVLERLPEARLSWRPHPRSMSLGQLAFHIATIPGGVAQVAAQDTFEIDPNRRASGRSSRPWGRRWPRPSTFSAGSTTRGLPRPGP